MKTYRRLSRNERDEIAVLLARRWPIRKIAFLMSRSHATISREIKRNKGKKGYGPIKAHLTAHDRQHKAHRPPLKLMLDSPLRERVTRDLKKGWSPEIIAGRLKRENGTTVIGHEAIYRWIYSDARSLIPHLVRSHRRRRPRGSHPWPKQLIPQRVSIHQRPEAINLRQELGHWETDLVIGSGRSVLQVLVERKSRLVRLHLNPNKTAQASYEALSFLFAKIHPSLRQSITYDNGLENLLHVEINQRFGLLSFFCTPYHSWEKGTVENTNGLIRRFLPKKTNFNTISQRTLQRIEFWLNSRPRKCLNFQTSAEVLPSLMVH
jgi:transposase, IS30 family